MIKENHIYEIMGKYLAHETTEKENEIFLNWLNKSEDNSKEFEIHKNIWETTQINFKATDSETVFKNVLNIIDDQDELGSTKKPQLGKKKTRNRIGFIAKIAASILLIATLAYYFTADSFKSPSVAVNIIKKRNIAGQKSKIFLPDGSEVWLNSESKISFPEKFLDGKREVILEGEAFFDVIKNPEQPFIVKTGIVSTTVLGTSFNVKAFEEETTTYVALKSGKVKIEIKEEENSQTMLLEPGEALNYNRKKEIAIKEKFDPEMLLSWKDGIIYFKDADLDEIVHTLSRWYGVQIKVENKKNEAWEYTGSFDNEILENVLNSISFTKGLSYKIDQKNVTIHIN